MIGIAGVAALAAALPPAAPAFARHLCRYGDCALPWGWDDEPAPPVEPSYPQGFVLTIQMPPGPARRPGSVLNRYPEIGAALSACWDPSAAVGGARWGAITLRVSFKRDGSVNGIPKIVYVAGEADKSVDADLRRSLLEALAHCTPLALSPSLGQAIAGQIFAIRFTQRGTPI